ncbi:lipase family protein [Niveispirillum irakense]|uniref:lipase family protein n=1 Tax=Niveispirillum irakense TaxID=34011 RepID=UPI00040C8ADD|nr:hypothetical protein [Niveispirillum irakense]
MGSVVEHAAETARVLLDLVDLAAGDLVDVFPPSGLNLVTSFSTGKAAGGAQGMFLTGTIAGIDTPVCVLAVAARWPLFQSFFVQEYLTETWSTPASIGLEGKIAAGYAHMFDSLRPLVWNGLATVARVPGFTAYYPLLVVGMGPGGPLAQLLTLELRPGRAGPGGAAPATSPASAIGGYSFSTPPFGDGAFAASAARALPPATAALFRCNAEGLDFYPSSAGMPAGFTYSGTAKPCQGRIPPIDTPWLDRTPAFYQTAYGQPLPALPENGTLDVTPPGFNRDLAYTLSCLCADVYARRQHPELGISPPLGCRRVADVLVGGVLWATLYKGPFGAAVAIRGPVSWTESLSLYGNGTLKEYLGAREALVLTDLTAFHVKFHKALLDTLSDNATVLTGKGDGNLISVVVSIQLVLDPKHPLQRDGVFNFTLTGTVTRQDDGTVAGVLSTHCTGYNIFEDYDSHDTNYTVTGLVVCNFTGKISKYGTIERDSLGRGSDVQGTFTGDLLYRGTVLRTFNANVYGFFDVATYVTGHDYGGALAALSAVRLKAPDVEHCPHLMALYGFGTVRFCDEAYVSKHYNKIAEFSYQLIRRNDVIAGNGGPLAMAPLPSLIHLSGGILSPLNSTTGHALALYASLLNPQLSGSPQAVAEQPRDRE